MGAKSTILGSAIALILIGALVWHKSAPPVRESDGDAAPAAKKQSASASQNLFLPRNDRAADQAPSPDPSKEDPAFVRQLAESDARAAAHWAVQLPVTPGRLDAIKAVAIAWANEDLPGVVEWVRQLPDETERQSALISIGFEAARVEPLTALALAVGLNADSDRDELIRHAAAEWATTDPDAAAQWARQIGDGPLRTRILAS